MRGLIGWIWRRGVISTFLSGLFAILPLIITVVLVTWVADKFQAMLGPGSRLGQTFHRVGGRYGASEAVALIVGWSVVLVGIWLLGLLVKSRARYGIERLINGTMKRIPIVKGIYGTVSQLVAMLNRDDDTALKTMSVVFCTFGETPGGGFLALLASPDTYRFDDRDFHVVYVPTSPLPMSGGIVFVPCDAVRKVDMTADALMQIYFSLGVLSPQAVPTKHIVPASA